jgi:hypothetical protein
MRVDLTIQYLFIHILDFSCLKIVFDRQTKLNISVRKFQ